MSTPKLIFSRHSPVILAAIVGSLLYKEALDLFVVLVAIIMFSGSFINILAENKYQEQNKH